MENLHVRQKKNRILYRELFLKAHEGFKGQINGIKSISFCKKCDTCCKIRYAELSPSEIFKLKKEGDSISAEYTKLFVPYGAGREFDYEVDNLDVALNNGEALKANPDYVNLVLSKAQKPVYFYYCRYLDNNNKCTGQKSSLCSNFPDSVTTVLPVKCGYREWQKAAFEKIKNEISKDILTKIKEIEAYRNKFSCNHTATCCNLACSEFSYEELKEKARNGDNFAKQFTGIFIPYENFEDARKIYPEYVDLVINSLDEDEKIYFYHCPLLTEDKLCSDYENRPQICRQFPSNPLSILPTSCGYHEWKEEVEVAAMLLHALVEITEFYTEKVENALLS